MSNIIHFIARLLSNWERFWYPMKNSHTFVRYRGKMYYTFTQIYKLFITLRPSLLYTIKKKSGAVKKIHNSFLSNYGWDWVICCEFPCTWRHFFLPCSSFFLKILWSHLMDCSSKNELEVELKENIGILSPGYCKENCFYFVEFAIQSPKISKEGIQQCWLHYFTYNHVQNAIYNTWWVILAKIVLIDEAFLNNFLACMEFCPEAMWLSFLRIVKYNFTTFKNNLCSLFYSRCICLRLCVEIILYHTLSYTFFLFPFLNFRL